MSGSIGVFLQNVRPQPGYHPLAQDVSNTRTTTHRNARLTLNFTHQSMLPRLSQARPVFPATACNDRNHNHPGADMDASGSYTAGRCTGRRPATPPDRARLEVRNPSTEGDSCGNRQPNPLFYFLKRNRAIVRDLDTDVHVRDDSLLLCCGVDPMHREWTRIAVKMPMHIGLEAPK